MVAYLFSVAANLNYPGIRVTLTSMWWVFFWGFLASNLANLALSSMNFARPYWTMRRATLRLLIDVAGAGLFCWLMKSNIVGGNLGAECARGTADRNYQHDQLRDGEGLVVCTFGQCGPHSERFVSHLSGASGSKRSTAGEHGGRAFLAFQERDKAWPEG